jgi:hypothetical protein
MHGATIKIIDLYLFYLLAYFKHNGDALPKKIKHLFSSETVTSVNNFAVNGCNFAPHDPHDWDEELGQLAQWSPVPTFRPKVYSEVVARDRSTFKHRMPQSIHRLHFGMVSQGIKARFRAEARNFSLHHSAQAGAGTNSFVCLMRARCKTVGTLR